MVQLHYLDQTGNRLFQYCLGRILAEQLGLALAAPSIRGFPGTAEVVAGREVDHPHLVLEGHWFDLQRLLADRSPRRLILRGWF